MWFEPSDISETINNQQLLWALEYALSSFLRYDEFLISREEWENAVYEVAISCKLARYIESYLKDDWFFSDNSDFILDTEYNKMGEEKMDKEICWIREHCTQNSTDKIRPDIIIHARWHWWPENNLSVFEVKKWSLSKCDTFKLKKLTDQSDENLKRNFWYQYGIWISNISPESIKVTLYKSWSQIWEYIYNR